MKRWFPTVLLQFDELVSAMFGGYANETLSYRIALNASKGNRVSCLLCSWLETFWPKHCDLSQPSKAEGLSRIEKLDADYAIHQFKKIRAKLKEQK